MNIKEAEKLTGVSSRNIRFYEQKGLLKPERNTENDYREYADEEIRTLKLIRALRMVEMPLEQIKRVVDGELSLQTAAAGQRQKIRDQIKKLETAAYFCEELAKPEQDIDEVLLRMDEPENRNFLSKEWRTDYAEKAKNICIPLLAGLLPLLFSVLLYYPMILAGAFAHGYLFVLSPLILLCWAWQGKRLYQANRWLQNALLFALFPVIALLLLLRYGPVEWVGGTLPIFDKGILLLHYLHYLVPLGVFTPHLEAQNWHYLMFFAINMGCFGLGMLLQWMAAKKKMFFLRRMFDKRPILVVMIVILLCSFLLIAPAFVRDLSPYYFDPVQLEDKCANAERYFAETDDGTVPFEMTAEFAEIAQFDQWERKYLRIFGEQCLQIYDKQFNADIHLTFCDNDCVIVLVDTWNSGGQSYAFRVPDGVMETLEEYIKEHTCEDGSALGE